MNSPSKEDIILARERAGLTQTNAAAMIYKNIRTWQQWEAGDRAMDPAFWELFLIKTAAQKQQIEGCKKN